MSSTADTDDVIEVSADGLTVRKWFTADEFPVPAIRFEIESEHDEQVAFRLSEDVPESFPMDKVGFHPDYHSDDWTAFQDHHVEFTGTLDPDERLVTVYGIRIDDESAVADFLTEPTVVEVSSEGASASEADEVDDDVIDSIVSEDRTQAVKDMIAGESASVPGLSDDADGRDDAETSGGADESDEDSGGLDLDLGDVDTDPVETDADDAEESTPDIDLGFEEETIPDADDVADIDPSPADDPDDIELTLEADDAAPEDVELSFEPDDADREALETDVGDGRGGDPEIDLGLEPDESATDETSPDGLEQPATDGEPAETADPEPEPEESGTEFPDDESDSTADETATEVPEPTADEDEAAAAESELGADEPEATASDSSDDATDDQSTSDTVASAAASTADTEPAQPVEPEGSIATQLAAEIRDGTVDDDDLEALRSALETEPSGADVARIDHLQSRVEEVAAYTDALSTFLDEQGTGAQLIEEVQSELASVEDEIGSMDDRLEETEDRVDTVETDVESLTEWATDLETDLDEATTDVESVASDLEAVTDDVEAVDETVDDLAADLATVEDDVDDLESDLEDVRADVTDIKDWRSQLGSMFSDD